MDEVPVVFIAGCSYSGSTMLGIVLGSDPRTFFAGEVNQYMRRHNPALRQFPGYHVCSCGERYEECALWGAVHERIPAIGDLNPAPGFGADNLRLMLRLLVPGSAGVPRDRETEYGALIGSIHAALRETGSAEDRIVDSSKSIRSLDALVRSSNVRVRVLHIVRDGEVVASSYKRRGYNVYYGMSAWVLVNAFLRLFLRRRKIPNLRIEYRTLCQFPDAELARIDAFLGTESSGKDVIEAVAGREYHIFAGNADVRGLTRGFPGIEFRGDRSALNGFERAVAGVFLRPVRRLLRTSAP